MNSNPINKLNNENTIINARLRAPFGHLNSEEESVLNMQNRKLQAGSKPTMSKLRNMVIFLIKIFFIIITVFNDSLIFKI